MNDEQILYFDPPDSPLLPAKPFLFEGEGEQPDFLDNDRSYNKTEEYLAYNYDYDQPVPLQHNHSISLDDGHMNKGLEESQPLILFDLVNKETPTCHGMILINEFNNKETATFNGNLLNDFTIMDLPPPLLFSMPSGSEKPAEEVKEQNYVRKSIRKNKTRRFFRRDTHRNESTKNIHRYITRQIIRSLTGEDFQSRVQTLCERYGVNYQDVKQEYLGNIERFTSIELLSRHWSVEEEDLSREEAGKRMVFREFSRWFLKERAIRYILNGRMDNRLEFIRYKNEIMLYYIDRPQLYKSNNKKKC